MIDTMLATKSDWSKRLRQCAGKQCAGKHASWRAPCAASCARHQRIKSVFLGRHVVDALRVQIGVGTSKFAVTLACSCRQSSSRGCVAHKKEGKQKATQPPQCVRSSRFAAKSVKHGAVVFSRKAGHWCHTPDPDSPGLDAGVVEGVAAGQLSGSWEPKAVFSPLLPWQYPIICTSCFTLMCFSMSHACCFQRMPPAPARFEGCSRADLLALLCACRCLGFVARDQCPERPLHPCLKSLLFEPSARAAVVHHGIAVRVRDL